MFRGLAQSITKTLPTALEANAVLAVYPLQLSRWLEVAWMRGGIAGSKDKSAWQQVLDPTKSSVEAPIGDIRRLQSPKNLLDRLLTGVNPKPAASIDDETPVQTYSEEGSTDFTVGLSLPDKPIWDHLFYAYLIEATGIFEILGDVVRRYVVGETLSAPTTETVAWARSTEELFFRDPPLFTTGGALMSQLRPDAAVNRRNAYWRMFGMDLPHPVGRGVQGQPWKVDVGPASNARFLELWNELLRQVWLGYENDTNSSGSKATDDSYIGYLCQTLSELLKLRRQGGMLAREEFAFVSMMSWFHLTVEYDTAVVIDLKANAGGRGNPADRLAAIGARVGIAPSRQSRELFELADLISPLMWCIELGLFNESPNAQLLYRHDPLKLPAGFVPVIANNMNRIIDLWQSGTGERVKDLAVTQRHAGLPSRPAQPARMLPGPLVATAMAAPNGNHPMVTRP